MIFCMPRVKDEGAARDAGFDPYWYTWNSGNDYLYLAPRNGWVRLLLYGGAGVPETSPARRTEEADLRDAVFVISKRGRWTGGELRIEFNVGTTDWFAWDASAAEVQAAIEAIGVTQYDVERVSDLMPWKLISNTDGVQAPISVDDERLQGPKARSLFGRRSQYVMYRVWMEEGDELRMRLGGRATVSGSNSPGSWASAGDMEDFENGKAVHGGYPDGGTGVLQTSAVTYGRSTRPWVPIFGSYYIDSNPGIPGTLDYELDWRCNGAGGASRVWLTPHPVLGVPREERLIIVEPGEGSRQIATPVTLFPSGDPSYVSTFPGTSPHIFTGTHRYHLEPASRVGFTTNPTTQDGNVGPWEEYGETILHPTGDEEDALLECSEGGVPYPAECLPGWEYAGDDFGLWDNMDRYATDMISYTDDYPWYSNRTNSSEPDTSMSEYAPEFHSYVGDDDPSPSPPSETEEPRVPNESPYPDDEPVPDPYPFALWVATSDTRFGEAGGASRGGDGDPSAFGPRRPGGGGFGGGAAGNTTELRYLDAPEGVGSTSPVQRTLGLTWTQYTAKAGGRWWNDARVDASGSWTTSPYEDPDNPDPLDEAGTNGPLPDSWPVPEPPLGSKPWLAGFGAAWLCPEDSLSGEIGWSLGHIASGTIEDTFANIFDDIFDNF